MKHLAPDLDGFFGEHRACPGDMARGVEQQANGSVLVWLACETCSVRIARAT
jgi:hypothetical protein